MKQFVLFAFLVSICKRWMNCWALKEKAQIDSRGVSGTWQRLTLALATSIFTQLCCVLVGLCQSNLLHLNSISTCKHSGKTSHLTLTLKAVFWGTLMNGKITSWSDCCNPPHRFHNSHRIRLHIRQCSPVREYIWLSLSLHTPIACIIIYKQSICVLLQRQCS